jgi:hypothetical protein
MIDQIKVGLGDCLTIVPHCTRTSGWALNWRGSTSYDLDNFAMDDGTADDEKYDFTFLFELGECDLQPTPGPPQAYPN